MNRWIALQVPLHGKVGAPLPGWTAEQHQATEEVAVAWRRLMDTRKAYRAAVRTLREGSGR